MRVLLGYGVPITSSGLGHGESWSSGLVPIFLSRPDFSRKAGHLKAIYYFIYTYISLVYRLFHLAWLLVTPHEMQAGSHAKYEIYFNFTPLGLTMDDTNRLSKYSWVVQYGFCNIPQK